MKYKQVLFICDLRTYRSKCHHPLRRATVCLVAWFFSRRRSDSVTRNVWVISCYSISMVTINISVSFSFLITTRCFTLQREMIMYCVMHKVCVYLSPIIITPLSNTPSTLTQSLCFWLGCTDIMYAVTLINHHIICYTVTLYCSCLNAFTTSYRALRIHKYTLTDGFSCLCGQAYDYLWVLHCSS